MRSFSTTGFSIVGLRVILIWSCLMRRAIRLEMSCSRRGGFVNRLRRWLALRMLRSRTPSRQMNTRSQRWTSASSCSWVGPLMQCFGTHGQCLRSPSPGGGQSRTEAVSWLAGRVVVAACAIGNPGPFLQAVGRATGQEVAARVYRDHHALGDREARELAASLRDRGAQALVVTQKDWTKLSGVACDVWPCPVVRPVLEVEFVRGEAVLGDAVREAVERVRSENAAAQDAR